MKSRSWRRQEVSAAPGCGRAPASESDGFATILSDLEMRFRQLSLRS